MMCYYLNVHLQGQRVNTCQLLGIIIVCSTKLARVLKTAADLFKFVNYDFSDI